MNISNLVRKENYMKLNTDKCHLIVSRAKYQRVLVKLGTEKIWESNNVKLLFVKI